MHNATGMLHYPNTIIAPLPRRTHSTPCNRNNNNNNYQSKLHHQNNLLQPHNSKPIKLNQDLDEVLSEFLSLFNPSEPTQSIPILISHQPDTLPGTPTSTQSSIHHTNTNCSTVTLFKAHQDPHTATIPTIRSPTQSSSPPPLESIDLHRSSVSSHPILLYDEITDQCISQNPNGQLAPATVPNHLSSIVSSPISRCHNPLPRHAGLDDLARQLTEPFASLHLDPHPDQHRQEEGEESKPPLPEEQHTVPSCDDLPSDLIPFLALNHS